MYKIKKIALLGRLMYELYGDDKKQYIVKHFDKVTKILFLKGIELAINDKIETSKEIEIDKELYDILKKHVLGFDEEIGIGVYRVLDSHV